MIKELIEYLGYYVDDSGKVYSMKYGELRELKPSVKKSGYLYVTLFKDGKRCYCRVHRLIAKAFIPNPDNLPEVNHKDENKQNNRADNLEWCDSSYNKIYGSRLKKVYKKVSDPTIHRKNNKSGYKGVFKTKYNTYAVYFNRKYFGTFKTFEEAVKVRQKAEKEAYNF